MSNILCLLFFVQIFTQRTVKLFVTSCVYFRKFLLNSLFYFTCLAGVQLETSDVLEILKTAEKLPLNIYFNVVHFLNSENCCMD